MKSVALLIGNSDNKLTQQEWAEFYRQIDLAIEHHAKSLHFSGASNPVEEFQNAAWVFATDESDELKEVIKLIREKYNQDSVAWLECEPQFI